MSWKKVGGIDYSKFTNNIHSNLSNFTNIETLKINSNNTSLHVGSNTLRIGNNTGETEQINAIWYGGLDLDNDYSLSVEQVPRTSMEEKYFRSEYLTEYIDDSSQLTKKELFIYKGSENFDRIRLKSSTILFDTYDKNFTINVPEDRYEENIRMIINNDGNIGINNLYPRTKLDVHGQLLAGYGSGVMGNGIVNLNTGAFSKLVMNGYYFCGKLGVAYDYSEVGSTNNNSKLKVEVFGGELKGTTGIGTDTYVICNNSIISEVDNDGNTHSVIFKSSNCGGVGLSSSGDIYNLCIYRCEDGTDDVYIKVNGSGATISIRAFLLSNSNFSMEMMQEQEIILQYESSDNSITPGNDSTSQRTAVYGPEADSNYQQSINSIEDNILQSKFIKYLLKIGIVERYDSKFGIGSDLFSSNMDFGTITGPVDINLDGSTYIKGNLRIEDHAYIENDVTINGRLFLNGEMKMNSVVMNNYQILEKAYIGAGLRLNSNQQIDYQNRGNITEYNQNYVIFDNTRSSRPTTTYGITQIDEYIENDNYQYDFLTIGKIYDNYKQYSDISIKPISTTRSNIGMGTTTPQNSLDINGNLCVGENYVINCTKVPKNSLIVEENVGIGTTVFPSSTNNTLRVSGSCAIGNEISNIVTHQPSVNGMLIQGAVGISIMEPQSILDIGGSLSFGDGSKQSFAATELGSKTNGIWRKMGKRSKDSESFLLNNLDYKITNTTTSKYAVDCNNNGSIILCGCNKSVVHISNTETNSTDLYEDIGSVTAYFWSGLKWIIMGNTLIGDIKNVDSNNTSIGERFGESISVSAKGHNLLIGSPYSCKDDLDYCGKVTLYNWKNGRWQEIFHFYGTDKNSYIGSKCKISKNGKHMVVAGKNINYIYYILLNDDLSISVEKIHELKLEENKDGIFESEINTNNFGCSIDITREGKIILVGSCNSMSQDVNSGCAYIYTKRLNKDKNILEFDENYFVKINSPDPQEGQLFGCSVSSNSLGTVLAVGSSNYNKNNDENIGLAAIYDIDFTMVEESVAESLNKNKENSSIINIIGELIGDSSNERFGSQVKLNGSGEYLSISSSGDTNIYGSISTYHYDSTTSWLRFTKKYVESDYTLPGLSIGVSSDSTILCYGYDGKYIDENTNCMDVLKLGSYENTFTAEILDIQDKIGIGQIEDLSNHPLEIVTDEYSDIIRISGNHHPISKNNEDKEVTNMDVYEGGILFENDFGGHSTEYLRNNDMIFTNSYGMFLFNYKEGFEICEIDNNNCSFYASKGFVGINNNNPESQLDVFGHQKIRDEKSNVLISTNKINPDIPLKYEHNIALGQSPFYLLKTGYKNIGIGYHCAYNVETGNNNIVIGDEALYEFDCKEGNIAIGKDALRKFTDSYATSIGHMSLSKDVYGTGNTAIGAYTDIDEKGNWQYSTAIGYNAKIGKSNSIILGDSNDENLCVGIGINAPEKRLHVNGDSVISGTLNIEKILYPEYGINIIDKFIVDIDNNLTTITNDLKVENNTTLETLVVNGICNPNSGININDSDCIIGLGGYSTFGKKNNNTSNKNNPLLTVNGFLQVNNDMDIGGTINANTVQTNSLIFIDLFKPNGGIAMYPTNSTTEPVFEVKKETGNTYISGNLSVDDIAQFSNGFNCNGGDATFNSDIMLQGALTGKHSVIKDECVYFSDKDTSGKITIASDLNDNAEGRYNGIEITGRSSKVIFTENIDKVAIKKDLQVDGVLKATDIDGGGIVPRGGIIMWSGSETEIPTGWALCNGANQTPDLRGRFIMGATQGATISLDTSQSGQTDSFRSNEIKGTSRVVEDAVNRTGGFSSVGLTVDQLALHNHTISDINHSHKINAQQHSHTLNLNQFNLGGYIEAYGIEAGPTQANQSLTGTNPIAIGEGDPTSSSLFTLRSVQTVAQGSNNSALAIGVKTWNNVTEQPNAGVVDFVSLKVNNTSDLGGTVTTNAESPAISPQSTTNESANVNSTNDTGKSTRFDNKPPYYVLAFIMRMWS